VAGVGLGFEGEVLFSVAMTDVERDLRLALEKCEQMLARLRAERHLPSAAVEREGEKVGEHVERMLQDLSPSPGRPSRPGRESESTS
jgi:hypothetical protein